MYQFWLKIFEERYNWETINYKKSARDTTEHFHYNGKHDGT